MRSTHSRRRPQRRPSIYGRRQAPGCKRTRLTVQDGGRAPVRAPVCLSSPACHPDTEGGTHSSTGAIICHREGGGGGVGAAASSRLQILASQSKRRLTRPAVLWCVAGVTSAARVSVLTRYIESGATTTIPNPNPNPPNPNRLTLARRTQSIFTESSCRRTADSSIWFRPKPDHSLRLHNGLNSLTLTLIL